MGNDKILPNECKSTGKGESVTVLLNAFNSFDVNVISCMSLAGK